MLVGTDPVHASAALAARARRTTRSQLLPMRLERPPAHGRQVVSFGRVHGFSATGGAGWAAGKLARRWRRRTTASVAIMLLGVWWSRDGRQRGRLLRRGASLSGGSFGTVGAGWTGGVAEQPICSGGCVLVRRKDSVLTHRVDRVALGAAERLRRRRGARGAAARALLAAPSVAELYWSCS